jgi:hypothetical protein
LELCDGEYLDVSLSLEGATEKEYFLKIKEKSFWRILWHDISDL